MSGVKTTFITIDQDELNRLRQRAAQAASLQEDNWILNQLCEQNENALAEYRNRINTMNGNLERLNRQLAEQGAAASKEAQRLRNQLQQTVRDSNERIQEAARKNEQQMKAMHRSFTEELTKTRVNLEASMEANNRRIETAMRENNRRIAEEMHTLKSHVETEMGEVRSRLDNVEDEMKAVRENENILLEMACEYHRAAQALVQNIQVNYRVELLCPGRLQLVQSQLSSSQNEIRDAEGLPQIAATARREARRSAEDAMKLYQDVLCAEQEWMVHFQAAKQVLDASSAQLESSRQLCLPEETDIKVDVDYWTGGDLEALKARLDKLADRMAPAAADRLTLSELDEIQSAGVQASREIDETVMFAAEAFFASQDRGEIAQDIADQLNEYGFSIVDYSYCGEDQRSAHRLLLTSRRTGFTIVITQTPVNRNGRIENKLESDILKYGTENKEAGDRIVREVFAALSKVLSSLAELGLEQGPVETKKGYENSVSDRIKREDMREWKTERRPEVVTPVYAAQSAAQGTR